MKDDQTIRQECLQMALMHTNDIEGNAVERARKYADFVLGKNDAEVIRAAGELAKAVHPK